MRLTPIEPEIPEQGGFTAENDIFGYREFGERLANLVSNIDEPLVINLDAPWGSGKSVFIKQWAGLMRARGGSVVYFDAFGNDVHDDAFLALASEIHFLAKETLGEDDSPTKIFLDTAKQVGKTFAPIGLRLAARVGTAGLLSFEDIQKGSDAVKAVVEAAESETEKILENTISEKLQKTREEHALLESFRESLMNVSKAIAEKGQKGGHHPLPLIFIVDELDRCRPPFALDVIERVKHLFSVPNVCFVLAMDLPQFETAIRGAYGGEFDAGTYLEKFYHLKIMLPDPNYVSQKKRDRYIEYLWRNLKPEFRDNQDAELVLEEIRFLVNAHELSLRKIERALTNVVLAAAVANESRWFIPPVVAGFCIMRQTHPDLYERAQENNLTWEDIVGFLKIDGHKTVRRHGDKNIVEREQALIWWRYLVDPKMSQRDIDRYLGRFPQEGSFNDRRSIQRTLTNLIDNLPNLPAHNT
ncbi:MAG: P-loop NTPase fold protein [Hyphomicrobiales bacterium]|nr:P-loop NTPase fold protein [Hyphomicrobiales bacterium]